MASLEAEQQRRRPVKGTEQSPILDTRAMRLPRLSCGGAEIRPDACRRITRRSLPSSPRCDAGRPPRPQAAGWQSGHDLHELHEFRELTEIINVTVKDVLDYLRIGEVAFEMSGCWPT